MSLLTDHLDEVGESYFEHMAKAMGFAVKMLSVAAICLVHAVAPFLFVRTSSDRVRHLADTMVKRQQLLGDQTTEQHPSPPLANSRATASRPHPERDLAAQATPSSSRSSSRGRS